jgi:predicted NAD/FAD-binding protein
MPTVTWMNRLQGIADDDARALAARKRLDQIQGKHRTRFCDAWTGYWIKGAYA